MTMLTITSDKVLAQHLQYMTLSQHEHHQSATIHVSLCNHLTVKQTHYKGISPMQLKVTPCTDVISEIVQV